MLENMTRVEKIWSTSGHKIGAHGVVGRAIIGRPSLWIVKDIWVLRFRHSISITTTTSPPTFLVFVNPAALSFRKISDASQEESHMGLIWHELFPVKGSFSESIIGRRLKDAPYCAK